MTLAARVIPLLLYRGNHLVKGRQFASWRVVGSAMTAARVHASRQVDELMMLDIGATPDGRGPDFKRVEQLAKHAFTPLTVGGGVRSVQDVRDLLSAGADKVAIGAQSHHVVRDASARIGRQALVSIIEHRGNLAVTRAIARIREDEGAGEILLQSVDRDGMLRGYDTKTIRAIAKAVGIPVVASCGCGAYEHMAEAIDAGASAVAAGSIFQFTDATPAGAAQYLAEHGYTARITS